MSIKQWWNVYCWGKSETLGEYRFPVPLCPKRILHRQAWDRKWVSVMRGQRMVWSMARAYSVSCNVVLPVYCEPHREYSFPDWLRRLRIFMDSAESPSKFGQVEFIFLLEYDCFLTCQLDFIFLPWCNSPSGPRRPHYRGFTIKFIHAILCTNPLDEWSARRRDLYLTTHNAHKR
jgi:hypothetical protein